MLDTVLSELLCKFLIPLSFNVPEKTIKIWRGGGGVRIGKDLRKCNRDFFLKISD